MRDALIRIFTGLLLLWGGLTFEAYAKQWNNGDGTTSPGYVPENGSGAISPGATGKVGTYASAGAGQYGVSINAATSLTVPTGATVAQICIESQNARYRDDGVAPTATVGMIIYAGTCFQYAGPLAALQLIGAAAGGTVDVSYYK